MEESSFGSLDVASALQVFSRLPVRDLGQAASVSRSWKELTSDDQLWRLHVEASHELLLPKDEAIQAAAFKPPINRSSPFVTITRPLPAKVVHIQHNHEQHAAHTRGPLHKEAIAINQCWKRGQVASSHSVRLCSNGKSEVQAVRVTQDGRCVTAVDALANRTPDRRTAALAPNASRAAFWHPGSYKPIHIVKVATSHIEHTLWMPQVLSCAFSSDGTCLALGYLDGTIANTRLPDEAVAKLNWGTNPYLTPSLSIEVIDWVGGSSPGLILAGTGCGHVTLSQPETASVKDFFLGSCDCPVSCVASFGEDFSQVVCAAYTHTQAGHGHRNAAYVWEAVSRDRVALLHPCAGGRLRGSSALGASVREGQVGALQGDGYKLAMATGKVITVFEARKWQPLYELSFTEKLDAQGSPLVSPVKYPSCLDFRGSHMAVGFKGGAASLLRFGGGVLEVDESSPIDVHVTFPGC